MCGRLDRRDDRYVFSYGRSYLERADKVTAFEPELPLDDFEHEPLDGPMPLCIDDAAPDSWGRCLVGNTDDHARNHAAFVLDQGLALTPAYDVSPQPRSGEVARHPRFGDGAHGRESRVAALADSAPIYHLTPEEGLEIADRQVDIIRRHWDEVCDAARLTNAQRTSLMNGPILNPYAFYR